LPAWAALIGIGAMPFIWAAVLVNLGNVVGTISTWLWNDVVGKFST
jgi:hypothetical protein